MHQSIFSPVYFLSDSTDALKIKEALFVWYQFLPHTFVIQTTQMLTYFSASISPNKRYKLLLFFSAPNCFESLCFFFHFFPCPGFTLMQIGRAHV